jgi:hypothetical protein
VFEQVVADVVLDVAAGVREIVRTMACRIAIAAIAPAYPATVTSVSGPALSAWIASIARRLRYGIVITSEAVQKRQIDPTAYRHLYRPM